MTRETKVGLAVAGSFLCLVAVVVSARLVQKKEPAPANNGSLAQAKTRPPEPRDSGPSKTSPAVKSSAAAELHDDKPGKTSPMAKSSDKLDGEDKKKKTETSAPEPAAPQLPLFTDDNILPVSSDAKPTDKTKPDPGPVLPEPPRPLADAKGKTPNPEASPTPPDSFGKDAKVDLKEVAKQLDATIKAQEQQSLPATAGGSKKDPSTVETKEKLLATEEPKIKLPEPPLPAPPTPTPAPGSIAGLDAKNPSPPGATSPNLAEKSPSAPSSAPAKTVETPAPVAGLPTGAGIPLGPMPPTQTAPAPVPPTPPPAVSPGRPIALAQASLPSEQSVGGSSQTPIIQAAPFASAGVPPSGGLPPIGTPPPATSPAIPIKSDGPSGINVKSYDVESYEVKAPDRSFADVSRKIYGSEQYAQALVLFNREHPLAADGLKQNPPLLREGTRVYFPGIDVLKSKYPQAFAAPAVQASNSPSSVQVGTPMPMTSSPGNPNAVANPPPGTNVTPATWTGADHTLNYRVRDGGERLYDIARNFLSDGNRWPEIYRLNRDLQPAYPIPAGTVIKLPANTSTP